MEPSAGQCSGDQFVSTKQVSQWLLSRNYLLTALELLLEAGEAGREEDVEFLEHLFSDPALFPPEEVVAFTGKKALDVQEMARSREERLAVTQYELRLAREDVRLLQRRDSTAPARRLSIMTHTQRPILQSTAATSSPDPGRSSPPPAASPRVKSARQRQVLNEIVLRYLLNQGYRITAGTLRSEAGSAVAPAATAPGTNAHEPDLPACFAAVGELQEATSHIQVLETELAEARDELSWRREEAEQRELQLSEKEQETERLLAALDFERSRVLALEEAVVAAQLRAEGVMSIDDGAVHAWGESVHPMEELINNGGDTATTRASLQDSDGKLTSETIYSNTRAEQQHSPTPSTSPRPTIQPLESGAYLNSKTSPSSTTTTHHGASQPPRSGAQAARSALDAVTEALPRLLPHVLINRRSEAINALVSLARDHPRLDARVLMTETLLNLIKRPTSDQRSIIVAALVDLCRALSPGRVQLEVLPALCGMAGAEHAERRVLLGACIAAIVQFLPGPAQAGTALGLVEHLGADPDPAVRLAGAQALAALLSSRLDSAAGQRVVDSLVNLGLDSDSVDVAAAAQTIVLPALLNWAKEVGALRDIVLCTLCPDLLAQLQSVVSQAPFAAGTPEPFVVAGTAVLRSPSAATMWKAMALMQMLLTLIPFLHEAAVDSLLLLKSSPDNCSSSGPADSAADSPPLPCKTNENPAHMKRTKDLARAYADALADWAQGRKSGSSARVSSQQNKSPVHSEKTTTVVGDASLDEILEVLVLEIGSNLVEISRSIAPTQETKGLRQRLVSTFQQICAQGDDRFVRSGVEPVLRAAAGLPSWCAVPAPSGTHIQEAARKLAPLSTPAELAGPWTVLPMLLAGVLPFGGAGALHDLLMRLVAGGPAAWALGHAHALAYATRFSAEESTAARAQILEAAEACADAPAETARIFAAAFAAAVAPTMLLDAKPVMARVLPLLRRVLRHDPETQAQKKNNKNIIGGGRERAEITGNNSGSCPSPGQQQMGLLPAQEAAVAAAIEVLSCWSTDATLRSQVLELLSEATSIASPFSELIVLRAALRLTPTAPPALTEWLLQHALLVLASLHQRMGPWADANLLSEAASVVFSLLYAIDGARFDPGSRAALHLAAALRALWREGELLTSVQRDVLAAVMHDAGVEPGAWNGPNAEQMRLASPPPRSAQDKDARGTFGVRGLTHEAVPSSFPSSMNEDEQQLVSGSFLTGNIFQDWRWKNS